MKKWFFLTFMMMLLSNSLVFSMQDPSIEPVDRKRAHLNTQRSDIENLGSFEVLPTEVTRDIVTTFSNHPTLMKPLRSVCKDFNYFISFQKADHLKRLLSGETLVNPFGWEGSFKFEGFVERHVFTFKHAQSIFGRSKSDSKGIKKPFVKAAKAKIQSFWKKSKDCRTTGNSTDAEGFSLTAITDAIAQNNIQLKNIVTISNPFMRDYVVEVNITTSRKVPSFGEADIVIPNRGTYHDNDLYADCKILSNFNYLVCIALSIVDSNVENKKNPVIFKEHNKDL